MDIGVPYRELARVDVSRLQIALAALTEADWDARPIRYASLSGGPHQSAKSIVMRHEWTPKYSKHGFQTLSESLLDSARKLGIDGRLMLPIYRVNNSDASVYTFPDWITWQAEIAPLVYAAIGAITSQPKGVLTRALFVRLAPGAEVEKHIDEQAMAKRAHRIHVCISNTPGCIYTIDGKELSMTPGVIYDFNNCKEHAVINNDDSYRINLMLEYLPDPEWVDPMPIVFDPEQQATLAPGTVAVPKT